MEEQNNENISLDELIKNGSLGVLALGYRGIEMWRASRPIIEDDKTTKTEEDEKKS
jgi:hypothetical protein